MRRARDRRSHELLQLNVVARAADGARGLARRVGNAYAAARLRPVWSGVYASFDAVPARGPGFEGGMWVGATRDLTTRAFDEERRGRAPAVGDGAMLPVVAAIVAQREGRVRILDFGGGMGLGFIAVRSSIRARQLEYVVVETSAVCDAGRELFRGDSRIRFATKIPPEAGAPDIVHVRSALQYVADPAGVLRALARTRPRYVLLVDLSAGEIPTFATAQLNVPGSVIPYWFLDMRDVVSALRDEGFDLVLSLSSSRRLIGHALPATHRLERARHLLFGRRGSA